MIERRGRFGRRSLRRRTADDLKTKSVMHHFAYRDGAMHAEDVDLSAIARAVGTPFYCYSSATIERHFRVFSRRLRRRPRARLLRDEGQFQSGRADDAGARSAPAWTSSRKASCAARRAAGVPGAEDHLLRRRQDARRNGARRSTRTFCASTSNRSPNSRRFREVAAARGRRARIAIRVNPDVDARTHAKISTGKSENKFGIPISRAREVYARARRCPA